MTLTQILALIRDGAIAAVAGYAVWFIYHSGESTVRTADLKAVTKQIQTNADTEARWQKEHTDALAHLQSDLSGVNAAIAANHRPVIVRNNPSPVSKDPPSTASSAAASGAANTGPGTDVRPGINSFEEKYEQALAQCRGVLNSWPH